MNSALLERIVKLEWSMFSNVHNRGGKASCQSSPHTFAVMRSSQLGAWPEKLLESYLQDLVAAAAEGRNIMSEKYAFMMERTFPGEYAEIASMLPEVPSEHLALIEDIVAVNLVWKAEMLHRYPTLGERGRILYSVGDDPEQTSFETYLRSELKTYSRTTLQLLHEHTAQLQRLGVNGVHETLLAQVRQCGYTSLEEAEKACSGCFC